MNPEEGELRPQLLDRFGLVVDVADLADSQDRAEAVRRRLAFESGPAIFCEQWKPAEQMESQRIVRAQEILASVTISPDLLQAISERCLAAGVAGLRADLTMAKAAAAWAAYQGRTEIELADLDVVAELALAHRRTTPPEPPIPPPNRGSHNEDRGWKNEDGGSKIEDRKHQYSILNLRSFRARAILFLGFNRTGKCSGIQTGTDAGARVQIRGPVARKDFFEPIAKNPCSPGRQRFERRAFIKWNGADQAKMTLSYCEWKIFAARRSAGREDVCCSLSLMPAARWRPGNVCAKPRALSYRS